jgi:hypothetical protein
MSSNNVVAIFEDGITPEGNVAKIVWEWKSAIFQKFPMI